MLKWLFILSLAVFLLYSCNKQDNLHVQHRQLMMLWYDEFEPLDASLNKQYGLLREGKLSPLNFSLQIQTLEYANKGIDPHFERYIKAKPSSKWPHLLYGLYLIQKAKNVRGGSSYASTPQVRIDKMHALLTKAMPHLSSARKNNASIGFYTSGWLQMNRLLGNDAVNTPAEIQALVQEAMARDGYVWRVPYAYLQTLYPQWGGSERAMQGFIDQVKVRQPRLGDALQADFYWSRGIRYQSSGDNRSATVAYEKAASIYPDSLALNALGNQYMRARKCDEAVEVFTRNLEENDPWDLYTLELSMQAHRCAGNDWSANRAAAKRSTLFTRYKSGK